MNLQGTHQQKQLCYSTQYYTGKIVELIRVGRKKIKTIFSSRNTTENWLFLDSKKGKKSKKIYLHLNNAYVL